MAAAKRSAVLAKLLARADRELLPKLGPAMHKGQAGRVAVVGGCALYTGAPYYAAISSLRAGGDLAFVLCSPDAATPIKSYSPELMVAPVLDSPWARAQSDTVEACLARAKSVVVGPGLGREAAVTGAAKRIIELAKERGLPIVLDGDALWLVARDTSIISGYTRAVLTPNAPEFARLWGGAFDGAEPPAECEAERWGDGEGGAVERDGGDVLAGRLALKLGGVTVLRKGREDWASDGTAAIGCALSGSARRCGGQGDVLAGAVAVALGWAFAAERPAADATVLAAFCASAAVRTAAADAFDRRARGTLTTDIIDALPGAFQALYPVAADDAVVGRERVRGRNG